jgi:antitoxin (DNA-binding transcriptional repressor) of toxin-antitoxin stability system
MTQIINIETSKLQLSDLLAMVRGGDEVIVQEADKPVAKLIATEFVQQKSRRHGAGLFAGKITMREDFDEELPMSFWIGEESGKEQ